MSRIQVVQPWELHSAATPSGAAGACTQVHDDPRHDEQHMNVCRADKTRDKHEMCMPMQQLVLVHLGLPRRHSSSRLDSASEGHASVAMSL